MKLVRILLVLGCFSSYVKAQDFHFSQVLENPVLINPAATGVFKGYQRYQLNQRNQWIGANTRFMTSSLAAEANFYKKPQQQNAHFGLGMQLYNDVGGDSRFGIQSGSLSLSGILPINDNGHTISAGIQGSLTSRKSDLSRVNFENQWNGTTFDPLISSGELNSLNNFRYMDAAAGIMYQYDASSTNFKRTDEKKFNVGVSLYHVNRPKLKYTYGLADYLYRKFVFHTSFSSDIPNSYLSYEISAAEFIQGPHRETLIGFAMKNRMSSGTKVTGYYHDAFFGFGLYARIKDAIIPRIFLDYNGFKLGISYDVTVSALRKAYKGGSLEFSLSFTNIGAKSIDRRR